MDLFDPSCVYLDMKSTGHTPWGGCSGEPAREGFPIMRALIFVLCAAGCGGAAVDVVDASCSIEDSGTDVLSIAANPDCLETDETIEACIAADAPGSWTAPASCVAPREALRKAWPQKKTDSGITQRASSKCCTVYPAQDGGIGALCCADLSGCLTDQ